MNRIWPWVVRFAGLAVVGYETLFERGDKPALILAALAMMAGIDTVAAYVSSKRGK